MQGRPARAAASEAMASHRSGQLVLVWQQLLNDPGRHWRVWLAAQGEALTIPQASVVFEPESVPMLAEAA